MKLKMRFTKQAEAPKSERVRFEAGNCPQCKRDTHSRVYKTAGKTRFCVCDGCGVTWTKQGDRANPLIELAIETLDLLGGGDLVKTENNTQEVCLVDAKAACDLANRISSVLP